MRLTKATMLALVRFGCAFVVKENLICVSWEKQRREQIAPAKVVTRLFCPQTASGPLLCLGFEISTTRILANYCWYPFNPADGRHRKYLSSIFAKGTVRLSFLANPRPIARTVELSPRQRLRMADLYRKTLNEFKAFPVNTYDFTRAVAEVEKSWRLVDLFQYVVTEEEMSRIIVSSAEGAGRVSPEHRSETKTIANELLEVFRPQYDNFIREYIDQIPALRRNFLFMLDLHREFEGDYEKFARFVANVIAAHTPKEESRGLQTATLFFKSIFKLISDMKESSSNPNESVDTKIQDDFRDLMTRIAGGQGVSIKSLLNLLSAIGFPLGGKPGRTPKDYSNEYALKAAGKTWAELSAGILEKDPETAEEFGGRKFKALTFEEKALLKNRVREGVRSYASRMNKPFPPKIESEPPSPVSVQENSE